MRALHHRGCETISSPRFSHKHRFDSLPRRTTLSQILKLQMRPVQLMGDVHDDDVGAFEDSSRDWQSKSPRTRMKYGLKNPMTVLVRLLNLTQSTKFSPSTDGVAGFAVAFPASL